MTFKIKSKKVKGKMPIGWVRVTWKDSFGKKCSSNIPISSYGEVQLKITNSGGVVIKEEY